MVIKLFIISMLSICTAYAIELEDTVDLKLEFNKYTEDFDKKLHDEVTAKDFSNVKKQKIITKIDTENLSE